MVPGRLFCLNKTSSIVLLLRTKTTSPWEGVIGLEIHAQIQTKSKLFSGASTSFTSSVNCNVSYFDAAIPGTLPVLNKQCVAAGIKTALSLNCNVQPLSMFDRKHYFYADLPAGYQITQQRMPLAVGGSINYQVFQPGVHKVLYSKQARIKQLQLEQDSGKSIHDDYLHRSLIDLNRAGIPLMEIVFEPDLHDGEEAAALLKELMLILTRVNTCSCKMEEGALRVDANISLRRKGEKVLGTRTEVKNISSVRGVSKAISYEIKRQRRLLESGADVLNETRAWDAENSQTVPMRDKEVKQDYRFMPEPNLPPLIVTSGPQQSNEHLNIDEIRKTIPELPSETRDNLVADFKLSMEHAIRLVNDVILLKYFYNIMKRKKRSPKIVANILLNELLTVMNREDNGFPFSESAASALGDVIDLVQNGVINLKTAQKVILEITLGNLKPIELVRINNWEQITDRDQLLQLCNEVLMANPDVVQQYKNGKEKVFGALIGKIAKRSNEKANLAIASKLLKELLCK